MTKRNRSTIKWLDLEPKHNKTQNDRHEMTYTNKQHAPALEQSTTECDEVKHLCNAHLSFKPYDVMFITMTLLMFLSTYLQKFHLCCSFYVIINIEMVKSDKNGILALTFLI